jgi:hypothetical protein
MTLEKEYGKLTLEQFRDVVRKLPEVRTQPRELAQVLREKPEKLKEVLGSGYHWAGIYERGFPEQIALLFVLLGWNGLLHEAAISSDPQERALCWCNDGGELDQWYEANKDTLEMRRLIWLAVVLQRNILSIMLYHRPLSSLVEQVRQGREGSDDAFFKAVRIDRSILSCPTFSDRLARAELLDDKVFFLHLRSALKGPLKKHWEALHDLRYAIAILREMGFDSLSDAQLEDLFVNKLKLYPKHESARKNLRKHFYEARRVSTTSK